MTVTRRSRRTSAATTTTTRAGGGGAGGANGASITDVATATATPLRGKKAGVKCHIATVRIEGC